MIDITPCRVGGAGEVVEFVSEVAVLSGEETVSDESNKGDSEDSGQVGGIAVSLLIVVAIAIHGVRISGLCGTRVAENVSRP